MNARKILLIAFLVNFGALALSAQQALEEPPVKDPQSQTKSNEPQRDEPESEQQENEPPPPEQDKESEDQAKEEATPAAKPRRRGSRVYSKRSEAFISVFSPVVASAAASVVEVTNGKKQIALGTVIDSGGLILTKASELTGDLTCRLANGDELKAVIVGIDPETDLVLLKVAESDLPSAVIEMEPSPAIGSWLATVNQDEAPLTVGIVSHAARLIKSNKLNSAIIGIMPSDREEGDGVRINRVFDESPAERAGLMVNDVITGLDGEQIINRDELLEQLSHLQPGDEIELKIKRGDEETIVPITLGKRSINPMMDRGSQQNRMGSTLSKRRSDFPLALQHDSTLNANECGGPVVDLSGRIVGINIARDGRVSSLALPNEVVIPVIAKLKSGKFSPGVVNKKEIKRVEKEIAQLEKDLGTLPTEEMTLELEFSAGAAVEKELMRQVKDMEKRLTEMQARLDKQKQENRVVSDNIADIQSKQSRIERKREPLQQELHYLKTGIK